MGVTHIFCINLMYSFAIILEKNITIFPTSLYAGIFLSPVLLLCWSKVYDAGPLIVCWVAILSRL